MKRSPNRTHKFYFGYYPLFFGNGGVAGCSFRNFFAFLPIKIRREFFRDFLTARSAFPYRTFNPSLTSSDPSRSDLAFSYRLSLSCTELGCDLREKDCRSCSSWERNAEGTAWSIVCLTIQDKQPSSGCLGQSNRALYQPRYRKIFPCLCLVLPRLAKAFTLTSGSSERSPVGTPWTLKVIRYWLVDVVFRMYPNTSPNSEWVIWRHSKSQNISRGRQLIDVTLTKHHQGSGLEFSFKRPTYPFFSAISNNSREL